MTMMHPAKDLPVHRFNSMVVPLKLVSFNTYLVARQFNQNRITYPERRAVRIQSFLRQFDLCFLQEVWGSGFAELTLPPPSSKSAVGDASPVHNSSFDLPVSRTPFLGRWVTGSLAELFYTLDFHVILQTGGLYDMARPSAAKCVYRSKHTFTKSRSKSRKGVEATLWVDIAAWNGKYSLLVFNAHLDPWNVDNKRLQVQEIELFMQSTLKAIKEQSNSYQKNSWSETGVLVVGDFNVKTTDEDEFQDLFASRGWRDFLAKDLGQTYAVGNSLVCYPKDCGRIDYIFGIDRMNDGNNGYIEFLPLRCTSSKIIRQAHGEELSDHYPIAVELLPDI